TAPNDGYDTRPDPAGQLSGHHSPGAGPRRRRGERLPTPLPCVVVVVRPGDDRDRVSHGDFWPSAGVALRVEELVEVVVSQVGWLPPYGRLAPVLVVKAPDSAEKLESLNVGDGSFVHLGAGLLSAPDQVKPGLS